MLAKTTIRGDQAMTIVPIGKINLQVKMQGKRAEYIEQVGEGLRGAATRGIEKNMVEPARPAGANSLG